MSQRSYTNAFDYSTEDNRFFIKFFLLDASINLNRWGVSESAIQRHINTFLGKPFVVTPQLDHLAGKDPKSTPLETALRIQEKHRVGTIIDVGYDERSGKAWARAEITDKKAQELIKQNKVRYVSPSISFRDEDIIKGADREVITDFIGMHVAGVSDPAFGVIKAQIKGQCTGSEHECTRQLQMVQASCLACGKVEYHLGDCVGDCLRDKAAEGKEIDDQAKAICLNECDESNRQSSVNHTCNKCKSVMSGDNSKLEETVKQLQAELAKYKQAEHDCPEGQKYNSEMGKCEKMEQAKKEDALRKEVADLRAALETERKTPYVDKIISAKNLKEEDKAAERERLNKFTVDELQNLSKEYESIETAKTQIKEVRMPKFQYASTQGNEFAKSAYSILKGLGAK